MGRHPALSHRHLQQRHTVFGVLINLGSEGLLSPPRWTSCSLGLLCGSRQDIQIPWVDDSLKSPLVPGWSGTLGMGAPTAPSAEFAVVSRRRPKPCLFPECFARQVPCGSGWFSQTIHLGRESGGILQPRGLTGALEPGLSRNRQGSWATPALRGHSLPPRGPVGTAVSEATGPTSCSFWALGLSSQLPLAKGSSLICISEVQSQGSQESEAAAGKGEKQEFPAAVLWGSLG